MRPLTLCFFLLLGFEILLAQKKPLDHTVYDGWQSIGEKMISNDGNWVVYTINVQEGDNELVIQSSDAKYKKVVPRGYSASISEDSRFAVFKIRPFYKDTREARIKKKRADDMPKDSLGIVELGKDSVYKIARVKNYKEPEKAAGWMAYHMEKKLDNEKPKTNTDAGSKKIIDSLKRTIDSLVQVMNEPSPSSKKKKRRNDEYMEMEAETDADEDEPSGSRTAEGTDLVLRNLATGEEKLYPFVNEYYFNKTGKKLLVETTKNSKDSLSKACVLVIHLPDLRIDTVMKGGNDFKNYGMTEDGSQLAFVAERDAKPKDLQKFYKLWYYSDGMDSAIMIVDKNTVGMNIGMTVSEFANISFSKSGKRLFFGIAPIQPPKDTTLVDFETAKLDIWHYNDDYLQPAQLRRLRQSLEENFLTVYDIKNRSIRQLESKEIPTVYPTNEGDGETFVGVTDFGKRVESQWTGTTLKDIYTISVVDGSKKLVIKDMKGFITPQFISPGGKYIMWYDRKARNYFAYDGETTRNITAKIKVPVWNEEYDSPDDPSPYGIMGWTEADDSVYIYDRYDIWVVDPQNKWAPHLLLEKQSGRNSGLVLRYMRTNREERFIDPNNFMLRGFNEKSKESNLVFYFKGSPINDRLQKYSVESPVMAKENKRFIFTKENFANSPDLYISKDTVQVFDHPTKGNIVYGFDDIQLSSINHQQNDYNWGIAELFKWKAYTGKKVEGIVYKPEDFDPKKKYPMICYFYETLSDGLYDYQPPSPTPSRLNIPFFVSRGYVVFAPDIHYGTGHPARDAYNHIVSGARALVKQGYIDSTRIGIQGQSWGGIQVAQLVTMTKLFKAAWAGAPVANMTSAYGGIRWESGMNRQFQYERTQSRIGATLWEKPQLYIESSPLFHLPNVTTPLVIMANDADGAVPWYQGIELFTAMRRLGKKVWMLNYNGEAHNLVERRNRKDIQIREQQYFDWLLKGERPAKWITEGVPAVNKGKDWGLELD